VLVQVWAGLCFQFRVPEKEGKNEKKGKIIMNDLGIHANAMCFQHNEGFVPACKQLSRFIGETGRPGIIPDVVDARLATNFDAVSWETDITTFSSEFLGRSSGGNLIIIVAHGIGPMSTFDGIMSAYAYEYGDKKRNRKGGRISQREFLLLESGEYGPVSIIDFKEYLRRYEHPFWQSLRIDQALIDPLVMARLGSRAEEYLLRHAEFARQWHKDAGEGIQNPWVLESGDALNCRYEEYDPDSDQAYAHLLTFGGLSDFSSPIYCHRWWGEVRLLGIKDREKPITGIHSGPNPVDLLRSHWQELMVPVDEAVSDPGFCRIMSFGDYDDVWFTQYPKKANGPGSGEPEFSVTSLEKLGSSEVIVDFEESADDFGYNPEEIRLYAPSQANAYAFNGLRYDESDSDYYVIVDFYRVEVDTSQRLMKRQMLAHDYPRMMKLIAAEEVAEAGV